MINLKEIIAKNEVKSFMLGRGKYYVRNRDFGNHDVSFTCAIVLQYLIEEEKNDGYKIIDNILIEILKSEFLSEPDLSMIIAQIWSYFVYRKEEGKLHYDWLISQELKNEIKNQIEIHKINKDELGQIDWTINALKNRFKFDLYS